MFRVVKFNLAVVCLAIFGIAIFGCGDSSNTNKAAKKDDGKSPGIIMLRYTTGSESTEQRERGFIDTIKKDYPEINILSDDQYASTTLETSMTKATDLLTKFGDRVSGIFAVCEPNAHGTLNALEEARLTDKVKFVGFDPNEIMVDAVSKNKMQGIVLQDPVQMGYLSVKTIVAHLEGEKVEKRISTGEYVATPENFEDTKMAALLSPPKTDESPEVENAKYRIAVVPKGTTHEFWKSVHFGAAKAAKELGNVELTYRGPSDEGNTQSQMELVENLVASKVDGICLAPNDSTALVESVELSNKKGVPVVIFDSGLNTDPKNYVSYVATDNYNGGVLAAHCLAKALGYEKPDASEAKEKTAGTGESGSGKEEKAK